MKTSSHRPRHPRHNIVLRPKATAETHKFECFQRFVLNAQPLLSPPALALAALIAFDSVATAKDVGLAYAALQTIHRYRSHPTIRWEVPSNKPAPAKNAEDGTSAKPVPQVHDERVISCFTAIAADEVMTWTQLTESITELEEAMQREMREKRQRHLPRSFAELMLAAEGHAGATLTSAARAHALGQVRMVALDPLSAARESSQLVIRPQPVDFEVEDDIAKSESLIERAVAMTSRSGGVRMAQDSRELELVEDLARACNAGNGFGPASGSAAVRRELAGVGLRIGDQHGWSRLLLLVAYDMLREGELAMSSIGRYFSGGAVAIFRALRESPLHKLAPKDLCEKLGAVEEEAAPSNKASVRVLAQALVGQLVAQDLVNPMRLPKGIGERYQGGVRAQIVWPHEIARINEWMDVAIAGGSADPVLPMVRCAIAIGAGTGMRIGEVMRIRLNNLAIVKGGLQIVVAPTRMDPTLKSRDSRRICHLKDRQAIKHLLKFLFDSHSIDLAGLDEHGEGSVEAEDQLNRALQGRGDLLFWDPHKSNALWHEATVRKWISIVLKAATGDAKTTFHDLRHAWVSLGNEADFALGTESNTSCFDLRANELGHAVNDLMFSTYTHIFGIAMRRAVDEQIVVSELLRTASIASWVGRNDTSLRKSLSRHSLRVDTTQGQRHLMNEVLKYAHGYQLPQAHHHKDLDLVPAASPLASFIPASPRIDLLLASLRSLVEKGFGSHGHAGIAARAGLSASEWAAIRSNFRYLNRHVTGVGKPPRSEPEPEAWLVNEHWVDSIDKASAPKWRPIARYLEANALADEVQEAAEYVAEHLGITSYLEVNASDPGFLALIKVFQHSETRLSGFALNCALSSDVAIRDARHAQGKVRSILGIDIPVQAVEPRDGRPRLYLTISSGNAVQANTNVKQMGGATSMKGLAALFLAAQLMAEQSTEVKRAA